MVERSPGSFLRGRLRRNGCSERRVAVFCPTFPRAGRVRSARRPFPVSLESVLSGLTLFLFSFQGFLFLFSLLFLDGSFVLALVFCSRSCCLSLVLIPVPFFCAFRRDSPSSRYCTSAQADEILYPHCPKEYREEGYRMQMVAREIRGHGADLVMLQVTPRCYPRTVGGVGVLMIVCGRCRELCHAPGTVYLVGVLFDYGIV